MTEKKKWFIAYSFNLWIPVSWEGAVLILGQVVAFALIIWLNTLGNGDRSFNLIKDWPMIPELIASIIVTLWISRSHVEKRY